MCLTVNIKFKNEALCWKIFPNQRSLVRAGQNRCLFELSCPFLHLSRFLQFQSVFSKVGISLSMLQRLHLSEVQRLRKQ